jgi:hypothetical protein
MLEQWTQGLSLAPDLIPAQPKNQPRTHTGIGTANGGTSLPKKQNAPDGESSDGPAGFWR